MHDRQRKQVHIESEKWERTSFKTHDAIIDPELYKKAQEVRLIRGGGQRGGRKTYVNVFAKLITCSHCGSAMVTMAGKGKEKYRYLLCSKRRRQGATGCANNKWIPYYNFRDDVITWISQSLTNVIDSEARADVAAKNAKIVEIDFERDSKKLIKIIDDNRKFLFEIRKRNMRGEIDDSQYEFEKKMYEDEIKEAESRLSLLTKKVHGLNNRDKLRDAIRDNLNELKSLNNYENTEITRMILSRLIEKIVVDKEGNIDIYSPIGKLN
jgi:site-specific DNA recombinase